MAKVEPAIIKNIRQISPTASVENIELQLGEGKSVHTIKLTDLVYVPKSAGESVSATNRSVRRFKTFGEFKEVIKNYDYRIFLPQEGQTTLTQGDSSMITDEMRRKYSVEKAEKGPCCERRYLYMEVPDDRRPGKTKKVSVRGTKTYELDPDGDKIFVKIAGEEQFVSISDLKLEDGSDVRDLSECVDKVLIYNGMETEPLNRKQAENRYKIRKIMQPTLMQSDAMKDSAYLKLANGEFVKEQDVVEPISWQYATSENYDAVTITTKGKSYIFLKEDIKDNKVTLDKELGGGVIEIKGAQYLTRTTFANADVVQTTSCGRVAEECQILRENKADAEVDKDKMESERLAFIERYKTGTYLLDKCNVDGKLQDLDENAKRYTLSDEEYELDGREKGVYGYYSSGNIKYKDGNVIGGPTVHLGKALGGELLTCLRRLGYQTLFLFTDLGIITAIVFPQALVALAALTVASAAYQMGKAVFNAIRYKLQKKFPKSKIEEDVKKRTKLASKELANFKGKTEEFDKSSFLAEYQKMRGHILGLGKIKDMSELTLSNGEGSVDANNMHLMKKLKGMNAVSPNTTIHGDTYDADQHMQDMLRRSEELRNLLYIQKFGETKEGDPSKIMIDGKEYSADLIDALSYDTKKGEILYKGKPIDKVKKEGIRLELRALKGIIKSGEGLGIEKETITKEANNKNPITKPIVAEEKTKESAEEKVEELDKEKGKTKGAEKTKGKKDTDKKAEDKTSKSTKVSTFSFDGKPFKDLIVLMHKYAENPASVDKETEKTLKKQVQKLLNTREKWVKQLGDDKTNDKHIIAEQINFLGFVYNAFAEKWNIGHTEAPVATVKFVSYTYSKEVINNESVEHESTSILEDYDDVVAFNEARKKEIEKKFGIKLDPIQKGNSRGV